MVFLSSCLRGLRVLVSIYLRYLKIWRVLFLLPFLTHIVSRCHLIDVRLHAPALDFCPQVHLLKFFFRPLQEWFQVSKKEHIPDVYLYDAVPAIKVGFKKFSRSFEILCF